MLTYAQYIAVALLTVTLALCVLRVLNCRLEETSRKRANGVNGWQLSILGTLYAVALGFMLSDAWLAYQTAIADVRAEASAVRMLSRTAGLIPAPCASALQAEAREYVAVVLTKEWPAMEQHRIDDTGQSVMRNMWSTLGSCDAHGVLPARESLIHALATLQTTRDARVQDFNSHLPAVMWVVLLLGATVVIASSCLLCNEKQAIHYFHVISLTLLITMTLLAISDLDRPFDGATRVDSGAFEAVQANLLVQVSGPAGK